MTSTIAARHRDRESGVTYPAPKVSRHAAAIGRRLHCTTQTAQKYLCSGVLEQKLAGMIAELIAAEDQEKVHRIMRPIECALAGIAPEALTKQMQLAAQELDLAEDLAESTWHAEPSREHLRRWQFARLKARAMDRRLDAAIAEELAR